VHILKRTKMNVVINNKELTGGVRKLEISVSDNSLKLKAGNCIQVYAHEQAPVCYAVVGEVKNESFDLYISSQFSKNLKELIVGDRIYKISAPFCIPFNQSRGERITVLAENESAFLIYPLIKNLYKEGKHIQVLLISSNHKESTYHKYLQKYTSNIKLIEVERKALKLNSVSKVLLDNVDSFSADMLYVFGNVFTVKEAFQYLSCRPKLASSVVLDATSQVSGNLKGLFTVSVSRKSKYYTVEGHDFYAVYRQADELINRFGEEEKSKSKSPVYSKTHSA
jgi:hypothetical protein